MSNLAFPEVEARPRVETRQGTYKVASTTLRLTTERRVELQCITDKVADFVAQSGITDGTVQLSSLHTTAGLVLNEIQDALLADVATMFEQVIPSGVYYKHNDPLFSDCDRKNAAAHLRAVVVGHSLSIPIVDGELMLGRWQQILFTEFDGPNRRSVHVQAMGI